MTFIARHIEAVIRQHIGKYPVLAITGPRQSGKTTMLKSIFEDYRYISLEDPDNRAFATDDPVGFLRKYPERVIFDEVQQVPFWAFGIPPYLPKARCVEASLKIW